MPNVKIPKKIDAINQIFFDVGLKKFVTLELNQALDNKLSLFMTYNIPKTRLTLWSYSLKNAHLSDILYEYLNYWYYPKQATCKKLCTALKFNPTQTKKILSACK
jgi:hypothetical protein